MSSPRSSVDGMSDSFTSRSSEDFGDRFFRDNSTITSSSSVGSSTVRAAGKDKEHKDGKAVGGGGR